MTTTSWPRIAGCKLILLAIFFASIFPTQVAEAQSPQTYTCSANQKKVTQVPREFFGLFTTQNYMPKDQAKLTQFMTQLKDAGFDSIRLGLHWSAVEKTQGVYDWESLGYYDSIFKTAQSVGIKIVPFVTHFLPAWATTEGTSSSRSIAPSHYADWTKFIRTAVLRYSHSKGTVAKVVTQWEGWNEPEGPAYFSGTPQKLVELHNLAYTNIKQVDSTIQVMSPATTSSVIYGLYKGQNSQNSPEFFKLIVKEAKFDILAIHVYESVATSQNMTKWVKNYLKNNGNDSNKNAKLAITETNLHIQPNCDMIRDQSETALANSIVDRYVCLADAGADYVYYFLSGDLTSQSLCNYPPPIKIGLFTPDFTPKLALSSMKNMISVLTNPSSKPGDLNQDGKVDLFDYNLLVSKFGNPYTIFDYNTLVANFGK